MSSLKLILLTRQVAYLNVGEGRIPVGFFLFSLERYLSLIVTIPVYWFFNLYLIYLFSYIKRLFITIEWPDWSHLSFYIKDPSIPLLVDNQQLHASDNYRSQTHSWTFWDIAGTCSFLNYNESLSCCWQINEVIRQKRRSTKHNITQAVFVQGVLGGGVLELRCDWYHLCFICFTSFFIYWLFFLHCPWHTKLHQVI